MPRLLLPGRAGLLVTLSVSLVHIPEATAQFRKGFLQQKVEVTLNRKKPPKVYLMATEIAVKVTAQIPQAQSLTERLATALQAELTSGDPRLKPSAQPGTIISCAISRLETTTNWTSREVTVRKKTGTRQVRNAKTGKYETEDVYSDVKENQRIQTVSGGLNISYQAADKSGAVLDSDSIAASYSSEFINGEGAPTGGAVEQLLVQRAIGQIVPRLVPTLEAVKVMLGRPNDQVDDLNKLAEAGLWSQMLQRLETMKPLTDPKREAYRIFNIGVANEALGYQASEVPAAKTLLEQAALRYARALEMKPDEEYFRDPQTRIDTAIAAYKTLEQQQAAYDQLVKAAQEAAAKELTSKQEAAGRQQLASESGSRSVVGNKNSGALTNIDVIDLIKSGLDHDNLVAAIKAAKVVEFDLSPAGLKQLLTNGVTNQVISVMRAKQQPAPATRKPAAPVNKPPTPGTKG